MAKLLKLRRGTTTQHGSFTGAEGEVTIDTTKDTAVVHDGSQAGGRPLLREDMANLPAGTIDNADVNASAAISGTKISPDFGSQDITTTGKIKFANVYSTEGDLPSASTYHGMFAHVHGTGLAYYAHGGNWIKLAKLDAPDFTGGIDVTGAINSTKDSADNTLKVETTTSGDAKLSFNAAGAGAHDIEYIRSSNTLNFKQGGGSVRMSIAANGTVDVAGNLDVGAGVDVTGNITATGTIDGRDVAADGTKLDGIESGSTGDQTAAEIRTLVESASDSNVFTDADHTKLNGIESGSTADQTAAEIKTLLNSNQLESAQIANNSITAGKLPNSEVTFAKIQNVPQNRIAGRISSGSGVLQELDGANVRSIINVEDGATADQTGSEIASALNGQDLLTTGILGRDSTDYFSFTDNNRLDLYLSGSNEFRFEMDGDFHADGDVFAYSTTTASDENLKKDIVTVADAVTKVEALKGVTFKWKKNDIESAGVIAQDVEKVLPQVVKTVADAEGNEYKAVNYGGLTSILIEAIKDLSARIKVLEAK